MSNGPQIQITESSAVDVLGLGTFKNNKVDLAAAAMLGLIINFNPDYLGPPRALVQEPATGANVGYTSTAITIGPVSGKYNGHKVVQCPGTGNGGSVNGNDLQIGAGAVGLMTGMTVVGVCDIANVSSTATALYLFAIASDYGSNIEQTVRFTGNTTPKYLATQNDNGDSASGVNGDITATGADLSNGEPFVYAWSTDSDGSMEIRFNSLSGAGATITERPLWETHANSVLRLGWFSGSDGNLWTGNIGQHVWFNKSYHKADGDRAQLDALMTAFRNEYGIS